MDDRLRAKLNLLNLSAAYRKCFLDPLTGELTPSAKRVLLDLGSFSSLGKSPLRTSPVSRQIDTHATCTAIGRAESVRRVWEFLHLDPTSHPIMKDEPNE